MLDLINFIHCARGLERLPNRLKVDTMLAQQGLVLAEALNEIPFVWFLFSPAGWLRRHDFAVNPCLDAVRTWLVLVAADFALLTEDAAVATGQLDGSLLWYRDMALAGEGGHIGGRSRHASTPWNGSFLAHIHGSGTFSSSPSLGSEHQSQGCDPPEGRLEVANHRT